MIEILTKNAAIHLKEQTISGFFGDIANFLFYPS